MSNGRILFIAGGCIMLSIAFFWKKKKNNKKKKERKGMIWRRRRRPMERGIRRERFNHRIEKKRQKEIKWNNIISYKYTYI
jgi:LPXTG-motif cell wall-anchored protein